LAAPLNSLNGKATPSLRVARPRCPNKCHLAAEVRHDHPFENWFSPNVNLLPFLLQF